MMGVELDRWQEGWCKAALGVRADGLYAAGIGGVGASIPRQVGKTFLISHLLIALCIEFPGLRCVWTSHHGRTTTNTFRAVQGAVRRPLILVHLKANGRTHGIRTGAGEQEIEFGNGSIIMFGAREQGFGRGMDAIDIIVFDEAQILGLKALEDMVPSTNAARHEHGALLFFIGTPPRPVDDGAAFTLKRAEARGGDQDTMWVEICGDDGLTAHEERQLRRANPSYPHRVNTAAMKRMQKNLGDPHAWRREALGIWDEAEATAARVLPEWTTLLAPGPPGTVRPVAFGVDRSPAGGVSVVAAWLTDTGIHLEEVFASGSLEKTAAFLDKACRARDPILIDGMSSACALLPLLKARRLLGARKTSTADMIAACALITAGSEERTVTHIGQESLDMAVAVAVRREVRSQTGDGWAWDRRDKNVAVHPLVAASLAVLGASLETSSSGSAEGRVAIAY